MSGDDNVAKTEGSVNRPDKELMGDCAPGFWMAIPHEGITGQWLPMVWMQETEGAFMFLTAMESFRGY